MKDIIVVDNFYENPDAVRSLALQVPYLDSKKLPARFNGTESKKGYFSKSLVEKLESLLGRKIAVNSKNYSFGVFSLITDEDKENQSIHVDSVEWVGLIYLNLPDECSGGTSFFRHLITGASTFINEQKSNLELSDAYNLDKWIEWRTVEMKFNRLVLFQANKYFHSAKTFSCFTKNQPRITQRFFFNLSTPS